MSPAPPENIPPTGSPIIDPESGSPEPPDAELVAQTLSGSPEAFDELFRRHQRRLFTVIYNMTLNTADTHDLLMEAFAKAYQSLGRYKGDSAFYSWLYRIAVNQTLNFLKRNKLRQHISLQDKELDTENRPEFTDTGADDPDRGLQLSDLQKKLNQALAKLSNEHRAVVTLADVQGLALAEVAKILNCSEGTVKSRLFYARKQLQKFLREYR